MVRTSFLGDMLNSLFDTRKSFNSSYDRRSIEDMCLALLTNEGEISGLGLSKKILSRYNILDADKKKKFFFFLNDELELDAEMLANLAKKYKATNDLKTYKKLSNAAEPRRQELLRRLNQSVGATATLVSMRLDLLKAAKEQPDLKRTDHDLVHLLRSWFNRGFLVLNQISWDTPAAILEKVVAYEAVHTIGDFNDLKSRLYPTDRRCFAYFHPSMPTEPLIFVEIALMLDVPSTINHVLTDKRKVINAEEAKVAVFYSISNCQEGLSGISFGNLLIKQVVAELRRELPNLEKFVTLSPIPSLNKWLESIDHISSKKVIDGKAASDDIRIIASQYLVEAKDAKGLPIDPVARFHLGNGAEVYEVHADADITNKGLRQSSGAMVNYLYNLKNIEKNHEQFVSSGTIAQSQSVSQKVKKYQSVLQKFT